MHYSFIDLMRFFSNEVKNGRNLMDILNYLKDEAEEAKLEIEGTGDGKDGVFGEAIDVAICAFDLIFKAKPDASDDEIMDYALKKCEKWRNKYSDK